MEGRIWIGKGAQATGMTSSLRIQSSKADSNTWFIRGTPRSDVHVFMKNLSAKSCS